MERSFRPGDVVFAQGQASEFVYIIKSGAVQIVRRDDSGEHVIAQLGAGAVFGEMAAIAGWPHAASVNAIADLVVEEVPSSDFVRRLSERPESALALLQTLVERLRGANQKAVDAERIEPVRWAEMRLHPMTERIGRQMPPGGLIIRNLPFRIGRRPGKREAALREMGPVHLILDDAEPYELDRDHFVIEDSVMGPILRDCGSRRGTIVNGIGLGGTLRHLSTPLKPGENEIVAGTVESPFRFTLSVLASEQPPHRRA